MSALCSNIANLEHGVWHNFVLYREVVIQVAGNLEGRSSGCDKVGWAKRRPGDRPGAGIVEQISSACKGSVVHRRRLNQWRIRECILLPNAIERAVIEEPESGTYCPFAIPERIISQTQPRPPIVIGTWIDSASEGGTSYQRTDCLSSAASGAFWKDKPIGIGCCIYRFSGGCQSSHRAANRINHRGIGRIVQGRIEVHECVIAVGWGRKVAIPYARV